MLKRGIVSSELWVVLLLIGAQFLNNTGVDISVVTDGVATAQEQVAEIARQLQAEIGTGANPTGWIAIAYVVGRQLLKWRELGQQAAK